MGAHFRDVRLRRTTWMAPTRAGQPRPSAEPCAAARAYPRSRGATISDASRSLRLRGLSPLARGNQDEARRVAGRPGPIPARAGQPLQRSFPRLLPWAYPRSRGATVAFQVLVVEGKGLSPLARGNLERQLYSLPFPGPIPARAGQPASPVGQSSAIGAYPRSRGATSTLAAGIMLTAGLSPLARGNRCRVCVARAITGPIPARAGQPRPCRRSARRSAAYPRSRGATFAIGWPCGVQ